MDNDNRTVDVQDVVVSDEKSVVKEITKKTKKRKHRFILLYIAIGVFAIYAVYALITQYSVIDEKKAQLETLKDEITVQEIKNEEINNIYNLSDEDNEEYIEQKAKEDGYLHAGERVFVNISGE
jgi:cell division protein FtsB